MERNISIIFFTYGGDHQMVYSHLSLINRYFYFNNNKKSRIYGHIWSIWYVYLSISLVHLRPILYTFEADSLYIWGWFSIHLRPIWANQTAVHLRQNLSDWLRHITWQNKLSLPQMYGIGLKCIENRPQMYRELASNVQILLSDWLRQWGIGLKCTEF